MKFTELMRVLEQNGFRLIKEKGSIRYYAKSGHDKLIRVIFMARKKSRQEPVMLFLRPQESGKGVSR
jgi:predicted RNA binding protein YcfA (HicA-like mRNA interferase family)